MSETPPPQPDLHGHLTGRKRLALVMLGAFSGALVALLFSAFSGQPTPTWEIILGAVGGALLGFSASLGEVRRKKATSPTSSPPPRGE